MGRAFLPAWHCHNPVVATITEITCPPAYDVPMIRLRPGPYDYRRKLPHYQKFDRPLFVTFCKRTKDPLSPAARSLVLDHCLKGNGRTMHLHAAVIMPEHVHLLLTPMRNAEGWPFPLKDILKLIKGPSARHINMLTGASGALWQDESFDHVLRSNESFKQKVEYIRQNPIRRGLAASPGEYPWLWVEPC
ncbi:MAG: transposase [Acidobacteria bacterium]|nr:transposase [Acidobacteriota bacterium]